MNHRSGIFFGVPAKYYFYLTQRRRLHYLNFVHQDQKKEMGEMFLFTRIRKKKSNFKMMGGLEKGSKSHIFCLDPKDKAKISKNQVIMSNLKIKNSLEIILHDI